MSNKAIPTPAEAADAIQEFRTLLASYDAELSGDPQAAARPRPAALAQEPLMLVNGVALDLAPAALLAYRPIEAPTIIDCCTPQQPETAKFVNVLESGVFRVHPRRGTLSAGLVGPFTGPPPAGVFAVAQTTHASAPTIRFHASVWTGDCDAGAIGGRLAESGQKLTFVTLEPGRQGHLISMAGPQQHAPEPDVSSTWGILLATMAEPPEKIEFAWADFSNICLLFSSAEGSEVAVLI